MPYSALLSRQTDQVCNLFCHHSFKDFVESEGSGHIRLRHYIISAGLREILDGVSIKKHFTNIFASEYHHNIATFPKLLITDTTSDAVSVPNKQRERDFTESINNHMPEMERPIPFQNITYVGDGETDVPSMTVTRQEGGDSIAVYKDGKGKKEVKTKEICRSLLAAGRVNFIAPADYTEGSVLERRVKILLSSVMARIEYQRELFACSKEHGLLSCPRKSASSK